MKKKTWLFMGLFLLLMPTFSLAQKVKPTTVATKVENGKTYMIYNAFTENKALNRADDRNYFLYATTSNETVQVDASHKTPSTFEFLGKGALWKASEVKDGSFSFESVLIPGKYINDGTLETTAKAWTVVDPQTSSSVTNKQNYTDLKNVWVIFNDQTYWNGNPVSFTTWTNGHPYQFWNFSELNLDTITYKCVDSNNYEFKTSLQFVERGSKVLPKVPEISYYTYLSGLDVTDSIVMNGPLAYTLKYQQPDTLTYLCYNQDKLLLKTVKEVYPHNTDVYERAPSIPLYAYVEGLESNNAIPLTENKTVTLIYKSSMPFEVTTIADGATSFPEKTVWYNLLQGKSPRYLYYNKAQTYLALDSASVANVREDKNLWCFTGSITDGFKLYNKAAGVNKILYSKNPATDGNTGGSTFPILTTLANATGNNTWDISVSSTTGAWWFSQHGISSNTMNNRAGKLAYWTGGADAGSNFNITPLGKSKFICSIKNFSLPGVRLMNKLKVTENAAIMVTNLPDGLTYNAERQLVEGIITQEGVYHYTATATTKEHTTTQEFTIEVSSKLMCPTPLMGWLSWNVFEGNVAADTVKAIADAFVKNDLPSVGFRYVIIDDLWHARSRNSDGTPQWNETKFPQGMKAVADYVHSKNLKFGIYSDAANSTCAGAFGSFGYETQDANAYAAWECDLLKYDYCGAPSDSAIAHKRYKTMGDALKATGRDFVFYICEWGQLSPWDWAADAGGQMWRISYDSRDVWNYGDNGVSRGLIGVTEGIDCMKDKAYYSGVNHFNDADMMMVGLHGKGKSSNHQNSGKGMTQTEYQTQFSMWSMLSSPLTLSCDLRKMSKADLEILKNKEVIALNQDPMGQQALLISSVDGCEVYAKDLENGDMAVALLNRTSGAKEITFRLNDVFLKEGKKYAVRDLWKHAYADTIDVDFTAKVLSHGTNVYRLTPYEEASEIQTVSSEKELKPCISMANGKVKIGCLGREGYIKKISISDASGRVIASTEGRDSEFQLPIGRQKGLYLINIVCCGYMQTEKIVL
ncbi:MAG: hypothetical protein RR386_03430 [Bacteroidaceae bacterium]